MFQIWLPSPTKRTSQIARNWFETHSFEILDWPVQSPDLNLMEHFWRYLKRQLAAYETEPTSMHELWLRVEVEWNKIPAAECIKLIESMPKRIVAVIKAKSGNNRY